MSFCLGPWREAAKWTAVSSAQQCSDSVSGSFLFVCSFYMVIYIYPECHQCSVFENVITFFKHDLAISPVHNSCSVRLYLRELQYCHYYRWHILALNGKPFEQSRKIMPLDLGKCMWRMGIYRKKKVQLL